MALVHEWRLKMIIKYFKSLRRIIKKINLKLIFIAIVIVFTPTACFATDTDFYSSNDILFYDNSCSGSSSSSTNSNGSDNSGNYDLPATKGGTGEESAIDGGGALTDTNNAGETVTFSSLASSLGQEYRDYYIAMRWGYVATNWAASTVSTGNGMYEWMSQAPRIVLVTNPDNGKSVYVAALEFGPGPRAGAPSSEESQWEAEDDGYGTGYVLGTPSWYTGRVSGLSPAAFDALTTDSDIQRYSSGAGPDLTYQWATNQNVTPGPTSDSASSSSSTNCSSSSSTGNKIADTAISFVWKDGDSIVDTWKDGSHTNQAYYDAVHQYNDGYTDGSYSTDCARFVGTVMRASGADPDYTQTGSSDQWSYVQESGKYEIISFYGQDDSILQPGDVLVHNGHTGIWTGADGSGKKLANASLGDHMPIFQESASWFSQFSDSIIARLKS